MWSILLQIYEAVRASVRTTPSSLSLSLSLSHVYSLRMSCHLAYRGVHSIAFTYELNYYMQLPMDCVAAVNLARCPLNNERMIRDKLSNGENDLNHAEHPPSSPPLLFLLLLLLVGLWIGQFLTYHIIDVLRRIALKAKSTRVRWAFA